MKNRNHEALLQAINDWNASHPVGTPGEAMSATDQPEMTSEQITRAICQDRRRRQTVIPRYDPLGWWECDLAIISDAGYLSEIEIKVSRADFKADLHKSRKARPLYFTPEGLLERKHDRLVSDASKWTPRRFWFACPWDLIKADEVPDYAGLIWFTRRKKGYERHGLVETEIKPAPFRHGHKASPNVEAHIRGVCYYRYLDLLSKITKP